MASDSGLEVTALRERCIPATVTRSDVTEHATLWQIACAGDKERILYIRCAELDCTVERSIRGENEIIDQDSGHR